MIKSSQKSPDKAKPMTSEDASDKLPKPGDETVPLLQRAQELDPSLADTLLFDDPQSRARLEKTLGRWGKALKEQGQGADPTLTIKGSATEKQGPSWLKTLQSATIVMKDGSQVLPNQNPKLSQYVIEHPLGEGGMGVVYQALQQNLRRKVALKMLQPSLEEDPELVEQFVLEAMVTGRLEHPNIVPVHDLGKADNQRLFMGMKLVRGESLKALLKREPADSPQRLIHYLDILSQVGDAMAYAHSEGILHRDLKPENVMVGKFGEVQVMDWGLAFAFRPQGSKDLKQLAGLSSGPSGTPAYMSPEQAEGKDDAIGEWSDVYLLGAMLYEILTGSPPHRGRSVIAVLLAAQAGEIQRPSERAPGRDIPYDLEELCLNALRADPKERIQSVEAFQDQVKIYQSHREALHLIDRARQLLQERNPGSEPYEDAKKAKWILNQALEIWPEADAATELLSQSLLLQIDHCLEQGFGAEALQLIEALPPLSTVEPKRTQKLEGAARRQMNKRRNRVLTATGLLVLSIFLGSWLSAVSTRLQSEDRQADAREQLPETTAAAWTKLHKDDPNLDQALLELTQQLQKTGWTRSQSDLRHLTLMASWQSLQKGHLGRAFQFMSNEINDSQKELFQRCLASPSPGSLATTLDKWRQATKQLPEVVSQLSQTILLASWSRTPQSPQDQAFLKTQLASLGATAALADWDSGVNSTFLTSSGELPYRFRRDPSQGRVFAMTGAGQTELWTYPSQKEHQGSVLKPLPLLLRYKEEWLLVVPKGGDILSLSAKTGIVRYRLRLHDDCLGLIPRPGGFYALQAGTWGPSKSRLIPATPDRWIEEALPGARESGSHFLSSLQSGEEKNSLSLFPNGPSETSRLSKEQISRGLKRDPKHPIWGHQQALLLHREGKIAERDVVLKTLLTLDLSPYERVSFAKDWAEAGDLKVCERFIDSALEEQVKQGLNPDLNTNLSWNPAVLTRGIAESLLESHPEMARRLLGKSREMATTLEGDRFPFVTGKGWMVEEGVFESEQERKEYARRAESLGGFFFSPPGITKVFDLVLLISFIVPTTLILSMLVLYMRSFQTQRADLRNLGFRTELSRWAAFFTHPTLRCSHTFLAYTSRSERLFLFFGSLINLLTKVFITTVLTAVTDIANMPLVLAHGHVGHPTLESFILDSAEDAGAGESKAHLKLRAEGELARRRFGPAGDLLEEVLKLEGEDGFALNNLGYLRELAGNSTEALSFYERAGAIEGEEGQVGRYNWARLKGEDRPSLSVTYKSFVRFHGKDKTPLRQFVTGVDFLNVVNLGPSVLSVMAKKVGAVNDGGRHLKRLRVALRRRGILKQESVAPDALRYITILPSFFIFVALVLALHLPFGTRSISVPLGDIGQRRLHRTAQCMNLILPGSLWMFQGRVVMGSLAMSLVPLLIFGIWRGFHPGLLESFAFPQIPEFFNAKNLSELTVSTWQTVFAVIAIVALAILYPMIWRFGYQEWKSEGSRSQEVEPSAIQ